MIEELCKAIVIGAGGAATLVLTPALLGLTGFTTAGVTAGSLAAWLMSYAATAGVGGGVIATLQSIGAAGLSWLGLGFTARSGSLLGYMLSSICNITISDLKIVVNED